MRKLRGKQNRSWLSVVLLCALLVLPGAAQALKVGDKAPEFELTATTGGKISLNQFRGKQNVLIEFYVRDFGPVWVANLSARKVDYEKFRKLNVEVLGISGDNPFSQKTFSASLKLPYALLSDFPKLKTVHAYDVVQKLKKDGRLAAKQAWFLIDKEGIVRGRWVIDNQTVISSHDILVAAGKLAK